MSGKYKIGKTYDVLCISATSHKNQKNYFVPVLGEPHIDAPTLGPDGTRRHWHLDYRFMTDDEVENFWYKGGQPGIYIESPTLAIVKFQQRKMMRYFDNSIYCGEARKKFEELYVGQKAKYGKCPHQGFDIGEENLCEVNGRKIYICPGHHLCFDKKLRVIPSPHG